MRNSAFCWSDSLVEPYVLWHYGLNWHDIACMEEDGKLPLKHVRWLLERVLHEPRLLTSEDMVDFDIDIERCKGWQQKFWHKRRHLVWLFRTALRLEEDLVCGI